MKFSQLHSFPGGKIPPLLLAGVTIFSASLYILWSMAFYRAGFPLDDAWIHQTYARNLAQTGRWEYFAGQPSAGGSTSPLWTFLISIGYTLHLNFHWWTVFLGLLLLFGTALLAELIIRHGNERYCISRIPWVGILFVLEWHIVWAAVSGMETILHIFTITLFFFILLVYPRRWFILGGIAGASIWVRPDGISLFFPLLIMLALNSVPAERIKDAIKASAGFALASLPYIGFNLLTTNSLLPNTFAAKQTEYISMQALPLLERFFQQASQPVIGAGILLLPLVLLEIYQAIIHKKWAVLSGFLWLVLYTGLYAVRLPVTYQHGRYAMPVIPVFLLLGCISGVRNLFSPSKKPLQQVIKVAWATSISILSIAFLIMGAQTFAQDVTYIESEMVDTAQWVATNIPKNELIAAHDIGALGYYGSHRLIDLAGLISPEVIPFMTDQQKLSRYLDEVQPGYLVTFPDWYPEMIADKKMIFSTGSASAQKYGGKNMAVYLWK